MEDLFVLPGTTFLAGSAGLVTPIPSWLIDRAQIVKVQTLVVEVLDHLYQKLCKCDDLVRTEIASTWFLTDHLTNLLPAVDA